MGGQDRKRTRSSTNRFRCEFGWLPGGRRSRTGLPARQFFRRFLVRLCARTRRFRIKDPAPWFAGHAQTPPAGSCCPLPWLGRAPTRGCPGKPGAAARSSWTRIRPVRLWRRARLETPWDRIGGGPARAPPAVRRREARLHFVSGPAALHRRPLQEQLRQGPASFYAGVAPDCKSKAACNVFMVVVR